MRSIFYKEIQLFFSSLIAYVVVIIFLAITGLFMWILPQYNIPDYGYLSMDKFFEFVPWVLMFLTPAVTMRMFPEEFKNGTIELLLTKPLNELALVLGKYLASLALVLIALLPTIIYVVSLTQLANRGHNLDMGGIIGSYIGLVFLAATFCGIGIFTSALSDNQIVAFLIAIFFNFIFYKGIEALSHLPALSNQLAYITSQIGLEFHYKSISRGVLDSRDLIYFISLTALLIMGTHLVIKNRNWEKK